MVGKLERLDWVGAVSCTMSEEIKWDPSDVKLGALWRGKPRELSGWDAEG
jgi:hypothetical protein